MPLVAESIPSAAPAPVKTVVRTDAKTGRLVRTFVAPAAPAIAPKQLTELVDKIAAQQGVEAPLVQSVIRAESNYNPAAVSPKGAQGLMQLIPSTARRFGVTNTFDATENIQGGVRYPAAASVSRRSITTTTITQNPSRLTMRAKQLSINTRVYRRTRKPRATCEPSRRIWIQNGNAR